MTTAALIAYAVLVLLLLFAAIAACILWLVRALE